MKEKPVVFAMANPEPEIKYHDAVDAGAAVVVELTFRLPQLQDINNALAFPGLFRGALDVHATKITEGMKLAAAKGLASLVGDEELNKDYIILVQLMRACGSDCCKSSKVTKLLKKM